MNVSHPAIASYSSKLQLKFKLASPKRYIVRKLLPALLVSILFGSVGTTHAIQSNATSSSSGADDVSRSAQMENAHAGAAPVATAAQTANSIASLPTLSDDFHVSVYANVAEPMKLSFAPDGSLYVGRQGGNDRIHKVEPCGGTVSEFGPPQSDPDAVLFDPSGRISGVRDSLLVGGGGILAAIFTDQTSKVIFNSGFGDVDDMKFDRRGRLVFSDDLPQVLVSTGSTPTVLFSTPNRPNSIAIADDNRIFLSIADGTIRIYNPNGTVADNAFATGLAGFDTYLAFSRGAGAFGNALYVLNGTELLRFTKRGTSTVIGHGFSIGPASGTGFVFGPDKALYVSDYSNNRILKITKGHHEDRHEDGQDGPRCRKQ